MTLSKSLLLAIAALCIALLGGALYLQYVKDMQPCPLCVIQRYAFVAIAVICLVFAILPRVLSRLGAALASLAALAGAGSAGWHLWIKAHPGTSCGIDPLETALNALPSAKWLGFLFNADGLCAATYPPILGLSIPQWSLTWFLILAFVLGSAALQRR